MAPKVERVGCGFEWPRTMCIFCSSEDVSWLDGHCDVCGESWDPSTCARRVGGETCGHRVRTKDWRDWDLEPPPEDPPAWIMYLVYCARGLGRQAGGMGPEGRILEGEAQSMLALFPAHQHALIRRVLGIVDRVDAECDREQRIKDEENKTTEGS